MKDTKSKILDTAEHLIKKDGVNGFSYHDLSREIGIKTASIHYYFPTKHDLISAIIIACQNDTDDLIIQSQTLNPEKKLKTFFEIYKKLHNNHEICLVGSLCSDLNSLNDTNKSALYQLSDLILNWVTRILEQGKNDGTFNFHVSSREKAIMIISSMLASVQIFRLTKDSVSFNKLTRNILKELKS